MNPPLNQPPVDFQLLFTRTSHTDSQLHAGQVRPHPLETRQRILELSEFDGQPSFIGLRVSREDIENQLGPIEHFDLQGSFEIARLAGGQIVVEDDHVRFVRFHQQRQLLHLAASQAGGRIRSIAPLGEPTDYCRPGSGSQSLEFLEWVGFKSLPGEDDAGQDSSLAGNTFCTFSFMHGVLSPPDYICVSFEYTDFCSRC